MELDEFRTRVDAFLAERAGRQFPPGFQPFDSLVASAEDISTAETQLNVRLPGKYAEFMKVYGGGMFAFVDLLPVISHQRGDDDVLMANTGQFAIPDFVAVAPVGTGDWWGFVSREGGCADAVSFWDHETGKIQFDSDDFLEFVASRGLRGDRGDGA
jgi:hypothetical protein